MTDEMPEGLSPVVKDALLPLRESLVKAGWKLGVINWDGPLGQKNRTLSFMAKSPNGTSVYVACEENGLVRRMSEFLDAEE